MKGTFDAYAAYYDLLYRDKDYAGEAKYVNTFIRKRFMQASQILELGCGTGAHAEQFARMGHIVHGVDMSQSMLTRAIERKTGLSSEFANRLTFSHGDIRTIRTGTKFDIVIALFHVMSYQTSNDDLNAVFETAYAHLSPGGMFCFDFWYGPAVLTEQPGVRVKRLEDEIFRVTRVAEPILNENKNTVDVNYTLFIRNKKENQIEEFSEFHKMRYLFLTELDNYFGERFTPPTFLEWMTENHLSSTTWSGFTCAIRK